MYNSYLGKQFLEKKFYYYILNNIILLYMSGKIEEIIFDCLRQSNIIKNWWNMFIFFFLCVLFIMRELLFNACPPLLVITVDGIFIHVRFISWHLLFDLSLAFILDKIYILALVSLINVCFCKVLLFIVFILSCFSFCDR